MFAYLAPMCALADVQLLPLSRLSAGVVSDDVMPVYWHGHSRGQGGGMSERAHDRIFCMFWQRQQLSEAR